MAAISVSTPAHAQTSLVEAQTDSSIQGTVLDLTGKPVSGAAVRLSAKESPDLAETLTDAQGRFTFSPLKANGFFLTAEKSGKHSNATLIHPLTSQPSTEIDLILDQAGVSDSPSLSAMQFADQPNFTVAGVTDFTAAGGHGSDSILRTSEALAKEASNLKPEANVESTPIPLPPGDSENKLKEAVFNAPQSFVANYRLGDLYLQAGRYSEAIPLLETAYHIDAGNRENEYDLALACKAVGDPAHSRKYVQELISRQESADLYRLAGELDESLHNSLAAVREYQKAVSLDSNEQNIFAWASELLFHRAIWQAQQVFEEGAKRYPTSSRMLTGLGTSLFAGAAYSEAATQLCHASDLNPRDQEPYIFLGKVQMAAPERLACIEQRLHRFIELQPSSATANYLYAMALQKGFENTAHSNAALQAETFLRKAIDIDPGYAAAYFQLGILCASRKNYDQAIEFYKKALAADPLLSDTYYRLAIAYDRTSQPAKAKEELKLHDEVAKQQAAEIERQRQEIKQFLIVLAPDVSHAPAP